MQMSCNAREGDSHVAYSGFCFRHRRFGFTGTFCAENLDRIRFGYSSISGSRIALWVTSEMGFFSKNGLAAETIVTPGIQGTQALIAGELQFYLGGIDSAALSASRGSDLVALATAEPIEYKLIAQPNINTVNELRGKRSSSIGSAARATIFPCKSSKKSD